MFGNPFEQMGLPTPQPPKEYVQRYVEGAVKAIATLIIAALVRICNIDIVVGASAWAAAYLALVVILYAFGVPKEFAIGNEVQLGIQHLVAFFVAFLYIDNGISTFGN